jgi:hypothetical protein
MFLIHVLKDQVRHYPKPQPLAVANIQQSEPRGAGTSLHTSTDGAMVLIHVFEDRVRHYPTLQPLAVANSSSLNREVPVLVYTD